MRILREPLFHFLLIGAAIFIASLFMGGSSPGPASPADKHIVISPQRITLLKSGFVLDTGHQPTDADMQRLINAYVREEILVREARAQGLDLDDSIVRRRLVQKMEFAVRVLPTPPESDLEAYLAAHPDTFRTADGKVPALSEIHGAVLAAWMNEQQKTEADAMYQRYRAEYSVSVEGVEP